MSDSESEIETTAKNQIWFKVENQTTFSLTPQGCFADYGDFSEGPNLVKPEQQGNGGHIISSRVPGVGSAGMVGYVVQSRGLSKPVFLRFVASNPHMSVKRNWSTALASTKDEPINQEEYNEYYYLRKKGDEVKLPEGILKVSSHIGQADQATALFTVYWSMD